MSAPQQPLFRVEADWPGGGFGYTLPFADAQAALAWGRAKARHHRDAEITVTALGDSPLINVRTPAEAQP